MLHGPNSEELFVLSSFFPEPINRAILRFHLIRQHDIYSHFGNTSNAYADFYKSRAFGSTEILNNLDSFWNNIKLKPEFLEDVSFINEHYESGSIVYYKPEDIALITELLEKTKSELNEYKKNLDALELISNCTLNQGQIMFRDNMIGLDLFRARWESKDLTTILGKYLKEGFLTSDLYEFEKEILYEGYRQVIISSGDDSRKFRNYIINMMDSIQNNKEISLKNIYDVISLINTIINIEKMIYHLNINIPMYVLSHNGYVICHPDMNKLEGYPYHEQLTLRNLRLNYHYMSSVDPDTKMPYEELITKRHYEEYNKIINILENSSVSASYLYKNNQIDEIFDENLLSQKYSPFVFKKDNGNRYYLTNTIISFDALFYFIWEIRKIEHSKRIGTTFENMVASYIDNKLDIDTIKQRVIIHMTGPGEDQRKYEIDIMFKMGSLLICLECKDYQLLEDPDDFKSLAQRTGLLDGDSEYFNSKIQSVQFYSADFFNRHPEFKDVKRILPILVTSYPELGLFKSKITIASMFEVVRLVSDVTRTDYDSFDNGQIGEFKDESGVIFLYSIFHIDE